MSAAGASSIKEVTELAEVKLSRCGNCGNESSQRCGNCRKESYCSRICQKARRKQHKVICFPAKEELGFGLRAGFLGNGPSRFWVATRDIKGGELIFTEYPLIIGPGEKNRASSRHICLGCHMTLKDFVLESDHRKCGDCGWPLCGLTCSGIHRHLIECKSLARKKSKFVKIAADHEEFDIYEVVRCTRLLALIQDDPIKYARLLNLDVPECLQNPTTGACSSGSDLLVTGFRFLKLTGQVKKLTTEIDFWFKVAKLYRCPYFPKEDMAEIVIYDKEIPMGRSCMENCYLWPIPNSKMKDSYGMVFVAAKPIQKGQRLSIAISESSNWDGTKRRRETSMVHFLDGGTQFCKCTRCSDPTELGTNVSAVKCTKCESGHLLPLNPLDDSSEWKCDTLGCSGRFPASDVDKLVNKIQKEADLLLNTTKKSKSSEGFDTVRQGMDFVSPMTIFVEKYGKILNPHHYILLNIQAQAMNTFNYILHSSLNPKRVLPGPGDISLVIGQYRTIAQTLLDIGSKICPPLSLLLLELHTHVGMSNFFTAQQAVRNEGTLDEVLFWLSNGISHFRSVMDFKTKTSLPLGFEFEHTMKLFGEAYNNVLDLCRLTPNYNGLPEIMPALDQINCFAGVPDAETPTDEKN